MQKVIGDTYRGARAGGKWVEAEDRGTAAWRDSGTRRGSADHGQYSDKALFILINRLDLLSP